MVKVGLPISCVGEWVGSVFTAVLHWTNRAFRAAMGYCLSWLCLVLSDASAPLRAVEPNAALPNFVFILGEGQGWASTSVIMDPEIPWSRGMVVRTPNLERMAATGMKFSSAYAPSPRCTPSRAAMLTGKSPAQLHMTFVNDRAVDAGILVTPRPVTQLPRAEATVASLLRQRGYATAQFGKWHVGRLDPRQHGFDESDGPNSNGGPDNVETPNPKQAWAITRLGIDFISRQTQAGRPFYVQICHYPARGSGGVRPETLASVCERMNVRDSVGKAGKEILDIAAMEDMDATIGDVWEALKAQGLLERTYVIYMPDHGTPGANGKLAGGKGGVWEGGVRVPLLVTGPGIVPGSLCRLRVSGLDLLPTIAELAGVRSLPAGLEGTSLAAVLKAPDTARVTRAGYEFVIHFPHYDKDPDGPASSIYDGNWKLIRFHETGRCRLYDLAGDPGERSDLGDREPELKRKLEQSLLDYLKRINAQMPTSGQTRKPSDGALGNQGETQPTESIYKGRRAGERAR